MLELPETSPTGAAGPVVNPLWFVVELKKASGKYDVTGRWPVGTGSNAVCATSLPGCITLDVLADDGLEVSAAAQQPENSMRPLPEFSGCLRPSSKTHFAGKHFVGNEWQEVKTMGRHMSDSTTTGCADDSACV